MPLVAEQGIGGLSLDEVARRADVTRNLLYHYFPRGRADIVLAVAQRAGHELTDDWVTDEAIPLPERMASNFQRFFEHSKEPSLAWRVHRLARASIDPELHENIHRFEEVVISGVSQNNFGTPDPPPIVRVAIKAFIVFAETLLDEGRASDVQREQVLQLVAEAFVGMMDALRARLA